MTALITYRGVQASLVDLMASQLLEIGSATDSSEPMVASAQQLLTVLVERHPSQVDKARLARVAGGKDIASGLVNEDTSSMAFVNAYSADAAARIRSIPPLLKSLGLNIQSEDGDLTMGESGQEKESAIEKIQLLLSDTDESVLQALYSNVAQDASTFIDELTTAKYLAAVTPQFDTVKPVTAIRQLHLRFMADHLDAKVMQTADSVAVFSQIIFPSLLSTANRPAFLKNEWTIIGKKGFFKDHGITGSSEFTRAVEQAKSVEQASKEQGMSSNLVFANAVSCECSSIRIPKSYLISSISGFFVRPGRLSGCPGSATSEPGAHDPLVRLSRRRPLTGGPIWGQSYFSRRSCIVYHRALSSNH